MKNYTNTLFPRNFIMRKKPKFVMGEFFYETKATLRDGTHLIKSIFRILIIKNCCCLFFFIAYLRYKGGIMGVPHLGGMVLYSRGGVLTRNYPISFLAKISSLTKMRISVEKKCDTLCALFSVTLYIPSWEGLFLK